MFLQAPFPYYGGKKTVARLIWERFGSVPNYVEPFFGSGATLLNRPLTCFPVSETVNDWQSVAWSAPGQSKNSSKERIWFSPSCGHLSYMESRND